MQNSEVPKRKRTWLSLVLDIVKVAVGYLAAIVESSI